MTDQQNNTSGKESHSFGDIPIKPAGEVLPKNPVRRQHKGSRSGQQPPVAPKSGPGRPPHRADTRKFPYLALLGILPAAFVLYLAAAYFLVPTLIKGPLAHQLSLRLNRPVSVTEASFDPFSLRLHLAGISIGSEPGRKDERELCRIAALDGRLLPAPLFRGTAVLAEVQISTPQANLIRYPDGGYSFQPARVQGNISSNTLNYMPSWLQIQGLQLTDGTVSFHDIAAGKEHRINKIQLLVPADLPGEAPSEPTLSAEINGSPVQVRSQRLQPENGTPKTRLSLRLNDIDLQQYLAYLPDAAQSLNVTHGTTDAELYLTLPGRGDPRSTLSLSGRVTTSALLLQNKDRTFRLKADTARIILKAQPLLHQYTVEELILDTPQLSRPEKTAAGARNILERLSPLLNQTELGLAVDRLQIDNGSLEEGGVKKYHNLHILLSGYRNQTAASASAADSTPARITITANNGKASMAFKGEVSPTFALTGAITLQDMDAELVQPYLPTQESWLFRQGKFNLNGTLLAAPKAGNMTDWEIQDSSLYIQDFSLYNNKNLLVKAQELNGSHCSMQAERQQVFCSRLSLDRAHFTASAAAELPGRLRQEKKGQPLFSFNSLSITNSAASIPLAEQKKDEPRPWLELSELTLDLVGMNQQQPGKLTMQAAAGTKGTVTLAGPIQAGGQGQLQLSATEIDLSSLTPLLSSYLTLPAAQGTLDLEGTLNIAANRFNGSLQVNRFKVETREGATAAWENASAQGVTVQLKPFSAAAQELTFRHPVVHLPRTDQPLPNALLAFFSQEDSSKTLPPVTIQQCIIHNGSLQLHSAASDDQSLRFTEVEGTFAPLQPGKKSAFKLSGTMNKADFSATGQTDVNGSSYELAVNHFSLTPFASIFSGSLGIKITDDAAADWYVASSPAEPGWIRASGLTPLPGSALSLVMALLIDNKGLFTLPLPPDPSGTPKTIISKSIPAQLQQLRLQAVISPRLVLDKFLPELNLPPDIEFLPGENVPDFMEGLEDYAQLLQQRPLLSLGIRGNYDDTDRQYLLQALQEATDVKRELENLRREELRTKLLADEELYLATLTRQGIASDRTRLLEIEQRPDLQPLPLQTVELPVERLQALARQRAEVIANYFSYRLKISREKITMLESGLNGTKTEIIIQPTATDTTDTMQKADSSAWQQLHLKLFPDTEQ